MMTGLSTSLRRRRVVLLAPGLVLVLPKDTTATSASMGMGQGLGGGSSSKFPHLKPGTVPTVHYHPATHGWWIRDMNQDRLKDLKKRELCLLCESDKHMLVDCPKKEQEFAAGNFYAYERAKKKQK